MKREKVKPQGRPRIPDTAKVKVNCVSLPEPYWEKLAEIGGGNTSKGVRIVFEAYVPDGE